MSDKPLPPPRPIRPAAGAKLSSEDTVGRDEDIARFWESLTSGKSLVLSEPRRLGKSATVRKLCDQPPTDWRAAYHSYQNVHTTIGLAEQVLEHLLQHASLPTKLKENLRKVLFKADLGIDKVIKVSLSELFRADPFRAVDTALRAVSQHLGSQSIVLVCDEVPDVIEAIAREEGNDAAIASLATWRNWRTDSETPNIRWLLTGSVGFHHVLRSLDQRMDLINDLESARLGPLSPEWTRWLVTSTLMGAGIAAPDSEVVVRVAELTGGFAMVVHMFAGYVRDRQLATVSVDDVEGILKNLFSDLDASQQMTSFLTRLSSHYGSDQKLAQAILDQLAHAPATRTQLAEAVVATVGALDGALDEERLRAVIDWLRSDHYLDIDDQGSERVYLWRYEALRLLWQMRRR
jgi:hypothetical protein